MTILEERQTKHSSEDAKTENITPPLIHLPNRTARQLLGDVIASKINFYRFIVFSYNETTNLKRLEFSNRILSYNSLVKTMIKCKVKPFAPWLHF